MEAKVALKSEKSLEKVQNFWLSSIFLQRRLTVSGVTPKILSL